MTKSIHTLIPDIYELVKRKDGWFDEQLSQAYANSVARRVREQFQEPKMATLRLSRMGPQCPKALWHSIHTPGEAEPLPSWAEIKYLYGHTIEALVIALTKAAGHEVTGEQDELVVDGITGHRDCIIDGCLCDIKSTSSLGFIKFKDKSIAQNDSFGYLDQLDGYLVGSHEDPLLLVKDKGYLLAVDKQLGHMVLYEHRVREQSIKDRIKYYKDIVGRNNSPDCECGTVPQGKSGNIQLDMRASYSPWKYCCFPHLRTFLYANGPVYLTHVERLPDVPEITKRGIIVN
jgi:hypothetical protein